jgi:hypothetical protein
MLANVLKSVTSGEELVPSSIELISSVSGIRTVAIPTHQSGDIIIGFASNLDSADTIPTPSGWTSLGGGSLSNAPFYYLSFNVVYKVATTGSQTITWSSLVDVVTYVVVRNATSLPTIRSAGNTTSGSSVTVAGLPFSVTDGSSAAVVLVCLTNKNDIAVSKPNPSFVEAHSTNVGTHQGVAFFKAGINYLPTTDLPTDASVTYARTVSIEIAE